MHAAFLQWGTEKEKVDIYQKNNCQSDLQVIKSGLIINPQWPWLCASPDRLLVTGTGLLVALKLCVQSQRKMNCD